MHLGNGGLESGKDRAAHDAVSDVQFIQSLDLGDGDDIGVVQGMPGVEPHPGRLHRPSGLDDGCECLGHGWIIESAISVGMGMGPGAGVDLADFESTLCCCGDLVEFGIDEGAGRDTATAEPGNQVLEVLEVARHVQPPLGRDLHSALRHQHGHLWGGCQGDAEHLLRCRHFEIQSLDYARQSLEIVILDVSAILTKVDGDPGGSASLRCQGGQYRIRLVDPPSLPDGGDVVDVHAESGHLTHPWMW